MPESIETPVLIVGGGPIGLTLAIDLSGRGIDVLVVERREAGGVPLPKCNHVSARSMEIFRRFGLAEKIRNTGLPATYPNDVSYRTTFTGQELTRIPIPCRRDRYTATEGPDTDWPTPEPPHRINQIFLEPVLFEHAVAQPGITILNETTVETFSQDENGVRAIARHLTTGAETAIDCRFLIGCDGGNSVIRKQIGAKFEGDAVVQRVQSTYIRAPELLRRQSEIPAWATFSLNPRCSGNVYAIDGLERWVVHHYLRDDVADFDEVDRDWAIRSILGVDDGFTYEVLTPMDWYGRRLVADRFRDRRVFLCGDSAHIWVPYAGYGMNAGIADAIGLSWTLAAHLNGWAPAQMLDVYERERLPITQQVSHFAMDHAHKMAGQRGAVPDNIEDDGPAGEIVRRDFGQRVYDLNVQQYCCGGLNFGSYYTDSPIIAHDDETPPGYSMSNFTPSTVPGCRTPHFFLGDGRSLYDAMAPEYTMLRLDRSLDLAPLQKAAEAKKVPLEILDVDPADAGSAYDRKLVLSRPDQHIAWRGNAPPGDPENLVALIRGAA